MLLRPFLITPVANYARYTALESTIRDASEFLNSPDLFQVLHHYAHRFEARLSRWSCDPRKC
jgi:hypothetical protein